GREFLMKDCYSFDGDDKGMEKSYEKMRQAYRNIFKRCGLNYREVEADPGAIGGGFSQEFMVIAQTGEEEIVYCSECAFAVSKELSKIESDNACTNCSTGVLKIERGIEVGHIFKLGAKYSEKMNAAYLDESGARKHFIMGCYGIGIGRTAAAAIEQNHDDNGIIWPEAIAPYKVAVIPVNVTDQEQMSAAEKLYKELSDKSIEAILDDRDERAGVKFKDIDLIGIPYKIILGKTLKDGKVEVLTRKTGERQLIDIGSAAEAVPG
ncbi:MAG: His/Gly/Thr/Pro-type tRNA ligase C-terminal domain-containing protein, partial [Candidatus Margulisiibacteriota bacterium]